MSRRFQEAGNLHYTTRLCGITSLQYRLTCLQEFWIQRCINVQRDTNKLTLSGFCEDSGAPVMLDALVFTCYLILSSGTYNWPAVPTQSLSLSSYFGEVWVYTMLHMNLVCWSLLACNSFRKGQQCSCITIIKHTSSKHPLRLQHRSESWSPE